MSMMDSSLSFGCRGWSFSLRLSTSGNPLTSSSLRSSQMKRRLQECGGDSWWQGEGLEQVRSHDAMQLSHDMRDVLAILLYLVCGISLLLLQSLSLSLSLSLSFSFSPSLSLSLSLSLTLSLTHIPSLVSILSLLQSQGHVQHLSTD